MNQRNLDKRNQAEARTEAHAKRTPEQQLAQLDARLGKGVGAARERAKLEAAK